MYGEKEESDATAIVRNGLRKVGTADVVIIDTAGRDSLDDDLKTELLNIAKIAGATEKFLVIDAQVGQAAGPIAETFHELVGVTGTIVTKLMVRLGAGCPQRSLSDECADRFRR